jgi:hypothetical protein
MTVPRRGFLKAGAVTVLASSLPLSIRSLAFAKPPSGPDSLRYLNLADFASSLDSWFTVDNADTRSIDRIRLVKVVDLRSEANRIDGALDGKECFLLVFSGAEGRSGYRFPDRRAAERPSGAALLPEDTFRLRHDRLGEFPLLLSPSGRDANGPRYSAVINRLVP